MICLSIYIFIFIFSGFARFHARLFAQIPRTGPDRGLQTSFAVANRLRRRRRRWSGGEIRSDRAGEASGEIQHQCGRGRRGISVQRHPEWFPFGRNRFDRLLSAHERRSKDQVGKYYYLLERKTKTHHFPLISYILFTIRPPNSTIGNCLKLLIRLARSGLAVAQTLLDNDLLANVITVFLAKADERNFYARPQHLAMKLVRIVASYGRQWCTRLGQMGAVDALKKYIFVQNEVTVSCGICCARETDINVYDFVFVQGWCDQTANRGVSTGQGDGYLGFPRHSL